MARSLREKSFLSADWINARLRSVMDRVERLIDNILEEGLLSSGYPPGEMPLTDSALLSMTPEQIQLLLGSLPTEEEKLLLLARLQRLKQDNL